jgi:hypothetical protein
MRNGNLALGDRINAYDIAETLRGEYGTFRVTTPNGDALKVTCKPGHSLASMIWADPNEQTPFMIEKIFEPAAVSSTPANVITR